MSTPLPGSVRERRGRGALTVLLALLAVGALVVGGSRLEAQPGTFRPAPIPVVGRTSTVCTAGPAVPGSTTSIGGVVIRQAPGRDGALTGTAVGGGPASLSLTEQGKGKVLEDQTTTQLLRGEGVMATASSGEVFAVGRSGEQQGLMAAPCTAPATEHWFVGVGAAPGLRSELVLTNPDDAQAEVDLQFFGEDGEVVVPGSPGVVVAARSTRTVSLDSLTTVTGPLTVSVDATTGRVAAVARDRFSDGLDPAGADWHTSAVAPARRLLIPGIPDGDGARQLLVANPGTVRAQVTVRVLALSGPFAPAGAASVEVPPNSTAEVDLAPGLVGQYAGVSLVSDRPVTGAVRSTSSRAGAARDVAVQSSTPALVRTGVVALATGVDPTAASAGDVAPGSPSPSEPTPGSPTPGEPTPGSPSPGESTPGSPLPGESTPGGPSPGPTASSPSPSAPPEGTPLPGEPTENSPADPGLEESPAESSPIDSELVLSNDANAVVTVSLEVLTYSGVTLRTDDVLLGPHSTSTRRLRQEAPAYLVVRVPQGSAVHGGVVYTQPEGDVAGLATVSLTSPDVASRAPDVVLDPTVGR